MPRRRDDRCRGCGDLLVFDIDDERPPRYCAACSDQGTKKALNKVYTQMNEGEVVRVIKSVPLRPCRKAGCARWAERSGWCKKHEKE